MKVNVEVMRQYIVDSAIALSIKSDHAEVMADNLITAQMWGINSHGVTRFPVYVKQLLDNRIKKNPDIKVESRYPAAISVDADNGLGFAAMKVVR